MYTRLLQVGGWFFSGHFASWWRNSCRGISNVATFSCGGIFGPNIWQTWWQLRFLTGKHGDDFYSFGDVFWQSHTWSETFCWNVFERYGYKIMSSRLQLLGRMKKTLMSVWMWPRLQRVCWSGQLQHPIWLQGEFRGRQQLNACVDNI